jgi:hypothetical protein
MNPFELLDRLKRRMGNASIGPLIMFLNIIAIELAAIALLDLYTTVRALSCATYLFLTRSMAGCA